jgi:crotonobetainyl-CoA:carnitine CoA-transferase CaiB-like acyl-CoA transferase
VPLTGVRVLEISGGIPSAYAAGLLADLGAEVLLAGTDGGFRSRDDALARRAPAATRSQ